MSETEEKKHKASARKLRKKREEGSIPNSRDSTGMLGTAAGIAACLAMAVPMWTTFSEFVSTLPFRMAEDFDAARDASMTELLGVLKMIVIPILLSVLMVSVTLTLIINQGFVFAMKPVLPDLKRVSISAGLKRIYGKRGWVEFGVALGRLTIWILFASIAIWLIVPGIVKAVDCPIQCQFLVTGTFFRTLTIGSILLLIVAAIVDIIVQRDTFQSEQRMTDTELKRERKDQAGSKEVRQERNRMNKLVTATQGVKLNAYSTTILFRASKGLVGINYDPPDQALPLICVKASKFKDREALTNFAIKNGIPIMDNERIVNNTMGKGVSEMLDVAFFRDFALALASR